MRGVLNLTYDITALARGPRCHWLAARFRTQQPQQQQLPLGYKEPRCCPWATRRDPRAACRRDSREMSRER